ncbi:MAG: RluA family pseudouridine synthase [Holosporales bacterium]|nr:RluA family pseudouridine synthase [Holosporales bacterium]
MDLRVTEDCIGQRLDVALSKLSGGISRTVIQRLIRNGCVMLGSTVVSDPSKKVLTQCDVHVDETDALHDDSQYEIQAEDIELEVLFEDEYLVVINKPAGLVCHPAPGHRSGTLVNAIAFHFKDTLSDVGGSTRPGIVHRLDKDTSGVMLIAKSNEAHHRIAALFANGKGNLISREYTCFVFGRPLKKSDRIDTMLRRHPKLRQQYTVADSGKRAITTYEVDKTVYCSPTNAISKLTCRLLTGRTHQIRVHMKYLGLHVIGDQVYGKSKIDCTYPDAIRDLKRQALHSSKLSFVHPFTGVQHTFEATLAGDLEQVDALFI